MSLICITGYPDIDFLDDEINVRGNGKTATMTYYLAKDYVYEKKEILTNYTTTFSKKMTTKQILDIIFDKKITNVSVGLDEFQEFLTSLGEKKDKVKYVRRLINQSRKKSIDIYYSVPTFKDAHNRVREVTNNILHPKKFHVSGEICLKDTCKQEHYIEVHCYKPFKKIPIDIFNPAIIGKLYDTYEILYEDDNDEF